MPLSHRVVESAIGGLRLSATETGLTCIAWHASRERDLQPVHDSESPILQQAAQELHEYFDGKRSKFTVPLDLQGTPFQLAVWCALQEIPYGTTCSYGQLARQLGNPQACRAVGAANGRNPVPIIVPCHRVIGSTGKLTGFGGGLPVKEFLLRLEASQASLL